MHLSATPAPTQEDPSLGIASSSPGPLHHRISRGDGHGTDVRPGGELQMVEVDVVIMVMMLDPPGDDISEVSTI